MAKLQIPQFWYSNDENASPLKSKLLWPVAQLYQLGAQINRATTKRRQSPLPVICVGNLTMGGAGKTPTARAILDLVKTHEKFDTPCFLMRGYGGAEKGPLEVNPKIHTSYNVGDEALMQARYAPTIIARDRYDGAQLAKELGYDIIIMDDGFQNPQLKKDLSLIVIDGGFGFGNGHVFPSGPLREPVASGIRRARGAIIINRTDNVDLSALGKFKQFDATIELVNKGGPDENKKVIAFAGIARPEKFYDTLKSNGYNIHSRYSFPDHHVFTREELDNILDQADQSGVGIITTEKDWIRLSDNWRNKISYLKIKVNLDDRFKRTLMNFLDKLP